MEFGISRQIWKWNLELVVKFLEMEFGISRQIWKWYIELAAKSELSCLLIFLFRTKEQNYEIIVLSSVLDNRKSSHEVGGGRSREVGGPCHAQDARPQNWGETELNHSVTCPIGRVVAYSASTPHVRRSILGLGKVDSAFHLPCSGLINEFQACKLNTGVLASDCPPDRDICSCTSVPHGHVYWNGHSSH
ncbi:hypothetical protein TNCV_3599921 [Trichonephila clavipes]|nr:hypothetical protein TNCV_3599921 [Trichonephila clavipes]